MGREYAHRRYGPNAHSELRQYYDIALSSPIRFTNSWYSIAENRSHPGVSIFDHDHIPAGFLHDLLDNNGYNTNQTPPLNESNNVTDNIQGYSISTIFNYLDGSTTSPAVLMNKLRNSLPVGNTGRDFDNLRNSYGY